MNANGTTGATADMGSMTGVSEAADQHTVGEEAERQEHYHASEVHSHDHYHVSHVHKGGLGAALGDDFEHQAHYHSHEHNHAPYVHGHQQSEQEEQADHGKMAHTHDHEAPTSGGL